MIKQLKICVAVLAGVLACGSLKAQQADSPDTAKPYEVYCEIVSTGGGAILRPENVTALRQNGRLFWLDRDPDALIPTDDRPLADTADKMKRLYTERRPVYRAASDEIIPVHDVPEKIAEIILSAFDRG